MYKNKYITAFYFIYLLNDLFNFYAKESATEITCNKAHTST